MALRAAVLCGMTWRAGAGCTTGTAMTCTSAWPPSWSSCAASPWTWDDACMTRPTCVLSLCKVGSADDGARQIHHWSPALLQHPPCIHLNRHLLGCNPPKGTRWSCLLKCFRRQYRCQAHVHFRRPFFQSWLLCKNVTVQRSRCSTPYHTFDVDESRSPA